MYKLFFACSFFARGSFGFFRFVRKLFFASFSGCGTGLKAIDTAFGVDDLFFTGKERVRSAADVYLDQWVFVAVFPFDRIVSRSGRLSQKGKTGLVVAKYDGAVCRWVYTALHIWNIVQVIEVKVKGV